MHGTGKRRLDVSAVSSVPSRRTIVIFVALLLVALYVHGFLVTNYVFSKLSLTTLSHKSLIEAAHEARVASELPPLFIYRRTRKTGSSSMLAALVDQVIPYGYTPLYHMHPMMEMAVRSEFRRTYPRRLFIAQHNRITRDMHPKHSAIIADTIRDGYKQITAFCRHTRHVPTCDDAMMQCLKSRHAVDENHYRWAGRPHEDDNTYIDLPLSSAHPALSTTALRTVFPNATLQIEQYNSANRTCPELPELRQVYRQLYGELDRQINELKKRLLTITGYPFKIKMSPIRNISLDDILDAAEVLERPKYEIAQSSVSMRGVSNQHKHLFASIRRWETAEDGQLVVRSVTASKAASEADEERDALQIQ